MSKKPTGRLEKTADGVDLHLERTFKGTPADVWESLTDPKRTARWYGPWEGEPGAGNTIRVQMAFEEGKPWSDVHPGATVGASTLPPSTPLAASGRRRRTTDGGAYFSWLSLLPRRL
ncbi:MAG: hypothetical protein KC657_23870 [Myxococcales bacterium]|nr:hypothetical protein [Myxococcales bacterium]